MDVGAPVCPHHAAVKTSMLLGQMVAKLGQGLGWGNAYTTRDAHPLPYAFTQLLRQIGQVIEAADIGKTLIYVKERLNAMDMAVYY